MADFFDECDLSVNGGDLRGRPVDQNVIDGEHPRYAGKAKHGLTAYMKRFLAFSKTNRGAWRLRNYFDVHTPNLTTSAERRKHLAELLGPSPGPDGYGKFDPPQLSLMFMTREGLTCPNVPGGAIIGEYVFTPNADLIVLLSLVHVSQGSRSQVRHGRPPMLSRVRRSGPRLPAPSGLPARNCRQAGGGGDHRARREDDVLEGSARKPRPTFRRRSVRHPHGRRKQVSVDGSLRGSRRQDCQALPTAGPPVRG